MLSLKDVIQSMGDLKKKKVNETSKGSRMPSRSELGVSDSKSNLKRIHLRNRNLPLVAEDYDDSGSKEVSEEVNQTLAVGNSIGFSMKDASKEVREVINNMVTPSYSQ